MRGWDQGRRGEADGRKTTGTGMYEGMVRMECEAHSDREGRPSESATRRGDATAALTVLGVGFAKNETRCAMLCAPTASPRLASRRAHVELVGVLVRLLTPNHAG